jgi:hypothetical protein
LRLGLSKNPHGSILGFPSMFAARAPCIALTELRGPIGPAWGRLNTPAQEFDMSESTGTAVQESAGHPKSFAPLDPTTFPSQLLWLAITFGLLYILVRKVVSPRVGSVIEERKNHVKGDVALAEEIRRDTQLELTPLY